MNASEPVVWPLNVSVKWLALSIFPSRTEMCCTSARVPVMPSVFVLIAIRPPELSSAVRSSCTVEMIGNVSSPAPPTIDAITAGDWSK